MLQKLSIRNFRLFEELDIEGFKRVNLIVGKNNTGKTTLLEAIRILEAKGHSTVVNNILKSRGQFTPSWDESYYALYPLKLESYPSIVINDLIISLKTQDPRFKVVYPSEKIDAILSSSDSPDFPNDKLINLPFTGYFNEFMQRSWDKISLTPLEDDVNDIIRKTIEPRLIRLDISSGVAKVRLEGINKPLPITVLGDGVQRILLIALAFVNAKNDIEGQKGKIILIDEIESGLHYSVQETLWKLIFEYAKKWDIQVFVTTHNQDTLNTFYYVANEPQNQGEGFLFRLQYSRKGKLEAIEYGQEHLKEVLEMNLEIR